MIWIVKSDDGDETFVPPEMPTSIQVGMLVCSIELSL